jgi:UDP:flavonoid glycosyltransferase YjiC (YdhE family)
VAARRAAARRAARDGRSSAGPEAEAARSLALTLTPPSLDDEPAGDRVRRFRAPADAATDGLTEFGDPEQPRVYLSFGTEVPSRTRDYFPGLYLAALEALADLPVRVLVTTGTARGPSDVGSLPPSVRVERWVPQAAAGC